MEVRPEAEAERPVLYDIHLRRPLPESLRSQYPSLIVRKIGAQTALRQQVRGPAQLDALLQKLCSVGLVLTDVHRLPPAASGCLSAHGQSSDTESAETDGGRVQGAVYEVRVQGELGETLLRYLRWSHYVIPEQTRVRLVAGSAELHRFLQVCTDSGTSIERVRRGQSAPEPSRTVRELSDA